MWCSTIIDLRNDDEISKSEAESTAYGRALLRAYDGGAAVGSGVGACEIDKEEVWFWISFLVRRYFIGKQVRDHSKKRLTRDLMTNTSTKKIRPSPLLETATARSMDWVLALG